MCVSLLPSSFVLVMGSKNNNGKFDFKAAGRRWTAFRKERVLQGYHMTLTWMVSQSCGEVGIRPQQFATIYQVDKKDFLSGEATIVIFENLISICFLSLVQGLDFHLMQAEKSTWLYHKWHKTSSDVVLFWLLIHVTASPVALNRNTWTAVSHSCRSWGKTL